MPSRLILRRQPPHKSNKYFTYEVTVTAGQATTPKFTFTTNVYNKLVDWGDGTIRSVAASAVELSHTYAAAGKYRVTFLMPHQDTLLTQIDINADKLSKVLTPIQAFRNLTLFHAYTNSAWVQNISGWVLPASLMDFSVHTTSVSGDISGWVLPASLVNFSVYSTSVSGDISGWVLPASLANFSVYVTSVSGDISGWVLPASLANFSIYSTSVIGSPIFTSAVALSYFQYQNCALLQATVDLIVSRIYASRASFTAAAPSANVGGTNAAPSGVYQDEDPPVTGKGYIYELVNDPEVEGFKKWAITYPA